MKVTEFIHMLHVAEQSKTLYVMGCFGAPMNDKNKARYKNNHAYNKQKSRQAMIDNATPDTFGFDCVNLIKGILWGWSANVNLTYGGATYKANDVPDVSADGFIKLCKNVSKDFSNIKVGEAVWMSGHIGVYIGDAKVIECTPSFENRVQITNITNVAKIDGMNQRKWTKHGIIPYLEYASDNKPAEYVPKVGDCVMFIDDTHYSSANALIGKKCKGGKAVITSIYEKGKHPYH